MRPTTFPVVFMASARALEASGARERHLRVRDLATGAQGPATPPITDPGGVT